MIPGGLQFRAQTPPIQLDPNRSDVACFVGFVGRREGTPVPEAIRQWLTAQGWGTGPYARPGAVPDGGGQLSLLDVPVPIESWAVFEQLFAPEDRPVVAGSGRRGTTYLGAAVRSFFAQGGRRCYVVRLGDPWPIATARSERLAEGLEVMARLIPGFRQDAPSQVAGSPSDRSSWHSVTHLWGLDDVSFLCLPDLCDAIAADPLSPSPTRPSVRKAPERFVACSAPQAEPAADRSLRALPAPRCDSQAYQLWARAINAVANFLEQSRPLASLRPVQLVAAVPLPQPESLPDNRLLRFLEGPEALFALSRPPEDRSQAGLASRMVQLVYPWVRSLRAVALPEQLESPDGVLVGVLARNALVQGTYRSAAGLTLAEVAEVVPTLGRSQLFQPSGLTDKVLLERISLLGPTPDGFKLLSDVTTSAQASVRPASVHRLIGVIVRAAQRLGESLVFESSGPQLWSRLESSLGGLMESLFAAGALQGATAQAAFRVRCDRTTMTQADLDNGRAIVQLDFAPALPVERIIVTLTLFENGLLGSAVLEAGQIARGVSPLLPALINTELISTPD